MSPASQRLFGMQFLHKVLGYVVYLLVAIGRTRGLKVPAKAD